MPLDRSRAVVGSMQGLLRLPRIQIVSEDLMLGMLFGSSGAAVGSTQVRLRLPLACLSCATLRGFVRGRRDNINGPGPLRNGVVAAAILRMGIADTKLAAVPVDCTALGELECERPIVNCSNW